MNSKDIKQNLAKLGMAEDTQVLELFAKLRSAGTANLTLDAGKEIGQYPNTKALLAALIRSLAAEDWGRMLGKGSLFVYMSTNSSVNHLEQETLKILSQTKDLISAQGQARLLQFLDSPPLRLRKRFCYLLDLARQLEPDNDFLKILDARVAVHRKNYPEAEKIYRRLGRGEDEKIRRLAEIDLNALLLETQRFAEAKQLAQGHAAGELAQPIRYAMAAFLLGELEEGLRGFSVAQEKIKNSPPTQANLSTFFAKHRGAFAYLLRSSHSLRQKLAEVCPCVFTPYLLRVLSKPASISRQHLRRAITMMADLRAETNINQALQKLSSFIEADLVALIALREKTAEVVAIGGNSEFCDAAEKRRPALEKELARADHVIREIVSRKRPYNRVFLTAQERPNLLAAPLAKSQFVMPLKISNDDATAFCILVEARYLFAPVWEELFFMEEVAKRYAPKAQTHKQTSAAKVPTQPKDKIPDNLEVFLDYSKKRFGYPIDLSISGQALRKNLKDISLAAAARTPILLLGESGVGKEVIARYIHFCSVFRDGPFVGFNCNAVPSELVESELFGHRKGAFTGADQDRAGLFEIAQGGTLLLDEIGDLKPDIQGKLLRVLQENKYRRVGDPTETSFAGRVLAATHQDLKALIEKGNFREDLFYRLNRFSFGIPALRERRDEILGLIKVLLRRFAEEEGLAEVELDPEAEAILWCQPWRGNVRALENFLYKLILFYPGERIGEKEIVTVAKKFDLDLVEKLNPRQASAQMIQMALDSVPYFDGKPNVSRAAQLLGWNRTTLHAKLKELS